MHLSEDYKTHGLRTPNEGKNQRYLKNWADVADKICLAVPKNLGLSFRPCREGYIFPLWVSVVRDKIHSYFYSLVSKQTLPEWTKAKTPMRTSEIRRSIFLGKNSGKLKENSGKLWTNSGFFFRQITARNMASRRCKVLIPKEAVPRCTGLRTSFG